MKVRVTESDAKGNAEVEVGEVESDVEEIDTGVRAMESVVAEIGDRDCHRDVADLHGNHLVCSPPALDVCR